MTVYARSDVMGVTVSRSHGGCGQVHSRPVQNGSPAKTWALSCPQCQKYLAHDPAWSGTLADVPSTPDEDLARESVEKNTARSREDIMALALAKIAGLPVAEFLGPMIGQAADAGTVSCPSGHENFPSAKFCAECGASMKAPVAPLPPATAPVIPQGEVIDSDDPSPAEVAQQRIAQRPRQPRQPRKTAERAQA